jgi:hypothetical protein
MPRYVTRSIKPRCYWDDDVPMLPSLSVPEHEYANTGLLDHRGDPILRAPNPMGFHHPRER